MTAFIWITIISVCWVTLLALNISRLRMRDRVGVGDGGNLNIKKALRAHINALEHTVPFVLINLALVHLDASESFMCWNAFFFYASRVGHASSFISGSTQTRQATASVTYATLMAAVIHVAVIA